MTADQFTYWLQGFSEVTQAVPTKDQWKIIQDHLALVFKKITPTYNPSLNPNILQGPMIGPGHPYDLQPKC